MNEVINDKEASRFVLDVNGEEIYLLYDEGKETIDLYSTYTPPQLRGQGLAEKVVLAAFEYAKEKNLKVIPTCWYVGSFLHKYPEYNYLTI